MATIKRKPVTPRMEDILLVDLEDSLGNPLLNKQMLDKLNTVSAIHGIPLRSIKDLADWVKDEGYDVTDVKDGSGNYIFGQAESDLLLRIAYYHPSAEKHVLHERIELTGDNPFTPEEEAAVTTVAPKSAPKEDSVAAGFKEFFGTLGKIFTQGG